MKIFLDTADVDAIKKGVAAGFVEGVTTNPTHVLNSGHSFTDVIREICSIVPGPVSAEAMGETSDELIEHAITISSLAPNVYVKIPMNVEGLKAVKILEKEKGIHCNVTMVFSPTQAFLAMKAGATFVSIVLSRLDAIAVESESLVLDSMEIKHNYGYSSEILAASLKTQNHVLSALRAGVDIISIPPSLLFQMYRHSLTDEGLAQFAKDWQKVGR
jgi:transaldolase